MSIQNRLTFLFSVIFGAILMVFMMGVYQFYSNKSKDYYFERLHLRGAVKIDLLDGEYVDPDILQTISENMPVNMEPQLTVYDENNKKFIYTETQDEKVPADYKSIVEEIERTGRPVKAWNGDKQIYGFEIEGSKAIYIVIVSGIDMHGITQLKTLRTTLMVAYLITLIIIIFIVHLFTKVALKPVADMTDTVKRITLSNHLGIRLDEGNRKDELSRLAIMFNQMLNQLEKSFNAQKEFVYNISHELRTPLAAIITELELLEDKPDKLEDYKIACDKSLHDARKLVVLSNNLLDMAKANYNPSEIAMHDVRIDELLIETCDIVRKKNKDYNIHLFFDDSSMDDDKKISVRGNEYLLKVALGNIIDNGCKYSDTHSCEVNIGCNDENVMVKVINRGSEIALEDIDKIFTPFFRGGKQKNVEGNGIGLALTKKIITIHDGEIHFKSQNNITEFGIVLKNRF